FIFTALVMWLFQKLFGKDSLLWTAVSMVLGIAVCYLFGSAWFYIVYVNNTGAIGVGSVLAMCVVPFIIPDLIKIALALVLSNRLRKILKGKLD
ncbi:MAG: biotin transporter BioY, partial [Firmicutes bacterium]|nr:biotin transporter BioY [Bacillota bacterium]